MPEQPVRLSGGELEYLKRANFLPPALARVIESAEPTRDENWEIAVSADLAEALRSAFTERLAATGFDADYEPTAEGRMLEGLIDRLYLG